MRTEFISTNLRSFFKLSTDNYTFMQSLLDKENQDISNERNSIEKRTPQPS